MRVLVIGGTDFVCPRVVWRLAEEDHEVTTSHRGLTEDVPPQGVKVALVVPNR